MTRALAAATRAQLLMSWRNPGDLFPLVNVPFFTVIFLSIVKFGGRSDLAGYAILAPFLVNLWFMALAVSGDLIARDRQEQVLELLVATPSPYVLLITGRILASTVVSLAGLFEAWTVARLGFGVGVIVYHPLLLALTLLATALTTASTAVVLSALFVVGRTPRMYQNSLSYPLYVLGGVFVPVSLLPAWLQLPAHAVYLSWSADLLRDCLRTAEPAAAVQRLGVIVLLGGLAYGVGWLLVRRVIDHLRAEGTIGLT